MYGECAWVNDIIKPFSFYVGFTLQDYVLASLRIYTQMEDSGSEDDSENGVELTIASSNEMFPHPPKRYKVGSTKRLVIDSLQAWFFSPPPPGYCASSTAFAYADFRRPSTRGYPRPSIKPNTVGWSLDLHPRGAQPLGHGAKWQCRLFWCWGSLAEWEVQVGAVG